MDSVQQSQFMSIRVTKQNYYKNRLTFLQNRRPLQFIWTKPRTRRAEQLPCIICNLINDNTNHKAMKKKKYVSDTIGKKAKCYVIFMLFFSSENELSPMRFFVTAMA